MKEYTDRSVRQKVEPRNRPQCEYNQLIFDEGENTTEQAVFFNKLVPEQLGIYVYKKMNLDTDLTPCRKLTQINPHLSMKSKTMKYLGDNIGEHPDELGYSGNFSYSTSKEQFMRETIHSLHFIK